MLKVGEAAVAGPAASRRRAPRAPQARAVRPRRRELILGRARHLSLQMAPAMTFSVADREIWVADLRERLWPGLAPRATSELGPGHGGPGPRAPVREGAGRPIAWSVACSSRFPTASRASSAASVAAAAWETPRSTRASGRAA